MGDVIKESAELAVSWIKANAYALKLTNSPKQDLLKDIDLHIHMPSGAVPKDGKDKTQLFCLYAQKLKRCLNRSIGWYHHGLLLNITLIW